MVLLLVGRVGMLPYAAPSTILPALLLEAEHPGVLPHKAPSTILPALLLLAGRGIYPFSF